MLPTEFKRLVEFSGIHNPHAPLTVSSSGWCYSGYTLLNEIDVTRANCLGVSHNWIVCVFEVNGKHLIFVILSASTWFHIMFPALLPLSTLVSLS